jgi:prophage antirepressor-like protein
VPKDLQQLLWKLVDTMNVTNKDYMQLFNVSTIDEFGIYKLIIRHSQEVPNYVKEHLLLTTSKLNEKIYVIDDGSHSTMLLAEEY